MKNGAVTDSIFMLLIGKQNQILFVEKFYLFRIYILGGDFFSFGIYEASASIFLFI